MSHHHIRILGNHHATHQHGAVLTVTDSHAQVAAAGGNGHLIHHDHAHELVKQGHAEWVGLHLGAAHPRAHDPNESHEDRVDRHTTEHADMLSRHASEHREMRERHEEEHKAAMAALGVTGLAVTGV